MNVNNAHGSRWKEQILFSPECEASVDVNKEERNGRNYARAIEVTWDHVNRGVSAEKTHPC